MVVVSSQTETAEYETMYSDVTPLSRNSFQSSRSVAKYQQSLGTILAIGEDEEEEEDEGG